VADIIIAAAAVRHGLDLEHCDRHFEEILPLAGRL
jgi:predicted nucleic acid-binding protein